MTDGPAPKPQRFGNHDDLVSVLLYATKRSWIKSVDESLNSIYSQRDLIEALHKLSPTLAFSKSAVLAALSAITEIRGWKLKDDSATEAMRKILGARLKNVCRHVSQAVLFFDVFPNYWFWFGSSMSWKANFRSDR